MIITIVILFVAYLVRGMVGFGSGLIAIPLLALHHPLSVVVPMVVLLDWLGSGAQGIRNRDAIAWPELLPLLPFTLSGVAIALYVFTNLEPSGLEHALGLFVLVYAVYQILPLPVLSGSRIWCAPAGLFGGLVGTLFGTGGPFYMIYLTIRGLEKSSLRASFAAYFLVDGSIRLVGFLGVGMLNANFLVTLIQWLPAAALGLLIGGRIHTEIPVTTFKYLISLLLTFSGYRLLSG